MKILDDYFRLQKQIYDYFGYVEDWCVFPIEDRTDFYWKVGLDGDEGKVCYWVHEENVGKFIETDGYDEEIFRNRFLPKSIYEGKDYTMITVDTHTDGNKFLAIYDNKKRR